MVQRTDRLKSFCVRPVLSKMVEEGKSFGFFHCIRYPFSFPPKYLGPFHGPLLAERPTHSRLSSSTHAPDPFTLSGAVKHTGLIS